MMPSELKAIALELLEVYKQVVEGIVEKVPPSVKEFTLAGMEAVVAGYLARIEQCEPEAVTSSAPASGASDRT